MYLNENMEAGAVSLARGAIMFNSEDFCLLVAEDGPHDSIARKSKKCIYIYMYITHTETQEGSDDLYFALSYSSHVSVFKLSKHKPTA